MLQILNKWHLYGSGECWAVWQCHHSAFINVNHCWEGFWEIQLSPENWEVHLVKVRRPRLLSTPLKAHFEERTSLQDRGQSCYLFHAQKVGKKGRSIPGVSPPELKVNRRQEGYEQLSLVLNEGCSGITRCSLLFIDSIWWEESTRQSPQGLKGRVCHTNLTALDWV